MAIIVTEIAAEEIKRYMEAQKIDPASVLRIGIAGGGDVPAFSTLSVSTRNSIRQSTQIRATRRDVGDVEKNGVAPGRHDDRFSRRTDGTRLFHRKSECSPRRRMSRLRASSMPFRAGAEIVAEIANAHSV